MLKKINVNIHTAPLVTILVNESLHKTEQEKINHTTLCIGRNRSGLRLGKTIENVGNE